MAIDTVSSADPPSSSGTAIPRRPSSPRCETTSRGNRSSLSHSWAWGFTSRMQNSRTMATSLRWLSVGSKFIKKPSPSPRKGKRVLYPRAPRLRRESAAEGPDCRTRENRAADRDVWNEDLPVKPCRLCVIASGVEVQEAEGGDVVDHRGTRCRRRDPGGRAREGERGEDPEPVLRRPDPGEKEEDEHHRGDRRADAQAAPREHEDEKADEYRRGEHPARERNRIALAGSEERVERRLVVAARVVLEEPEPVAAGEDGEGRVDESGDSQGKGGGADRAPRVLADEERAQGDCGKHLRTGAHRERRGAGETSLREPPGDAEHHGEDREQIPVEPCV